MWLLILAFALILFWGAGFFVFAAGSLIHLLLAIAVIAIIYNALRNRKL